MFRVVNLEYKSVAHQGSRQEGDKRHLRLLESLQSFGRIGGDQALRRQS